MAPSAAFSATLEAQFMIAAEAVEFGGAAATVGQRKPVCIGIRHDVLSP
jgi:hypothetical protein